MLRTIWDSDVNLTPPVNRGQPGPYSPPWTVAGGAETGILHQVVDLNQVQAVGDYGAVEMHIKAVGAVPGATTVTVFYAFASADNLTPAELLNAVGSLVMTPTNALNAKTVWMAPLVYQTARYLHIWFDHAAIAAGSTINMRGFVNYKRSG